MKEKCANCGKGIRKYQYYCKTCKEKEIKKIERNTKISEKRRLKSAVAKFEEYLKSGRRTY